MFLISFVTSKQRDRIVEATGVTANEEYSINEGVIGPAVNGDETESLNYQRIHVEVM
jgi:hypothetical protein